MTKVFFFCVNDNGTAFYSSGHQLNALYMDRRLFLWFLKWQFHVALRPCALQIAICSLSVIQRASPIFNTISLQKITSYLPSDDCFIPSLNRRSLFSKDSDGEARKREDRASLNAAQYENKSAMNCRLEERIAVFYNYYKTCTAMGYTFFLKEHLL